LIEQQKTDIAEESASVTTKTKKVTKKQPQKLPKTSKKEERQIDQDNEAVIETEDFNE
jgi:hypothetical protein